MASKKLLTEPNNNDHLQVVATRNSGVKKSDAWKSYSSVYAEQGTLGTWGAVFAIMSTIVGGGMVSIPWAFLKCGLITGAVFSITAAVQVVISSILYLKAREICPEKPQ